MASYSIKDLEKITGIKAHTIRIWEKRYGLINPSRTNTNIRYYNDSELRKLLNISILTRNGIKISKIAHFDNDEVGEKVMLFTQKSNKTEDTIESLILAMIEFAEEKFDRLLSNLIIKLGFEETFTKVLHPFFERVGILWQTGTIVPAQEHFVSNLVRQKLIVAIDSQRDVPETNNAAFLLFLPEGEFHELGLLFYHYALRKRGFKTVYLGQSLPISDLTKVKESMSYNYALTSFTVSTSVRKLRETVTQISELLSKQKVFIAGSQAKLLVTDIPGNTFPINSPVDFLYQLEKNI